MVKEYEKLPVRIKACEWTGDNYNEILDFMVNQKIWLENDYTVLKISTLEGIMSAQKGDFIIQGVQGEFYPCKPDIFAKTYREIKVAAMNGIIYFGEIPEEQREPFAKWLLGQTVPTIKDEDGKRIPCAWRWDYEKWEKSYLKGEIAENDD